MCYHSYQTDLFIFSEKTWKGWSKAEEDQVWKDMKTFITRHKHTGILPNQAECTACREQAAPILRNRSWQNIKDNSNIGPKNWQKNTILTTNFRRNT